MRPLGAGTSRRSQPSALQDHPDVPRTRQPTRFTVMLKMLPSSTARVAPLALARQGQTLLCLPRSGRVALHPHLDLPSRRRTAPLLRRLALCRLSLTLGPRNLLERASGLSHPLGPGGGFSFRRPPGVRASALTALGAPYTLRFSSSGELAFGCEPWGSS